LVVENVRDRLAMNKLAVKNRIWRDSISRSEMRGKLNNSIRLQSKSSLQLWVT
jgi:hypothetical protein